MSRDGPVQLDKVPSFLRIFIARMFYAFPIAGCELFSRHATLKKSDCTLTWATSLPLVLVTDGDAPKSPVISRGRLTVIHDRATVSLMVMSWASAVLKLHAAVVRKRRAGGGPPPVLLPGHKRLFMWYHGRSIGDLAILWHRPLSKGLAWSWRFASILDCLYKQGLRTCTENLLLNTLQASWFIVQARRTLYYISSSMYFTR